MGTIITAEVQHRFHRMSIVTKQKFEITIPLLCRIHESKVRQKRGLSEITLFAEPCHCCNQDLYRKKPSTFTVAFCAVKVG